MPTVWAQDRRWHEPSFEHHPLSLTNVVRCSFEDSCGPGMSKSSLHTPRSILGPHCFAYQKIKSDSLIRNIPVDLHNERQHFSTNLDLEFRISNCPVPLPYCAYLMTALGSFRAGPLRTLNNFVRNSNQPPSPDRRWLRDGKNQSHRTKQSVT